MFTLTCIFIFISSCTFAYAPVHDVLGSSHLLSLIEKAESKIKQLKVLSTRLNNIEHALSNPLSQNNVRIYQGIEAIFNRHLLNQKQLKEKNFSEDDDLINNCIYHIQNTYIYPKNQILKKSYKLINKNRKNLVKQAVESALALSMVNYKYDRNNQTIFAQINQETQHTQHAHQDIRLINQNLALMNEQILQMKEIQAKQLELISSVILSYSNHIFSGH